MTIDARYSGPSEPPTDPNGATGLLCNWLADFDLAQAPADVVERAKVLLLDGVACAIVGAKLPWSKTACDIVRRIEGGGGKTIIGWGATTSGPAAALLNGTFIQGFELDDFHPLGPLHSASLVLPALLACTEELGDASGREFLTAALMGFEVGPRVGMALHGAEMLSRGWHSGSVFGTHAAAVSAGRLLGLDASRYEDALGLAGTQSAGLMAAQYEAMCKRMHHGFSARNGLYAALLAAGGYTGIKRVFERPYGGFLSVFGEGHSPDDSKITGGLGEIWETNRIAIKPYAAMGALHGPLDGIFAIAKQRPLSPDNIEAVTVDMTHAAYHHGWWPLTRPITPIGAQMNVGYALAAAILDGAAMVHQFAPKRIDSDDVWDLIPRITARHDEALDSLPGRGSRVTVMFRDGSSIEHFVAIPSTVAAPLTTQGVIAKYRTLTDGLLPPDRQSRIEEMVLGIDTLPGLKGLISELAQPVEAAF
jgi:aconitate decarboxylase